MKVTIKSDGHPGGTHVYHYKNGQSVTELKPGLVVDEDRRDLSGLIESVKFEVSGSDIGRAVLVMGLVNIEAEGVAARMMAPNGKEVRRIEYEDGTVDEFPAEPPA